MWIFSKPLEHLVAADLEGLIGVRESQGLEFKELYDRRDPTSRLEMLRDVSSIANADGGVLILGIAEDGQSQAARIVPVPDAEAEADRLMKACSTGIGEKIPGLGTKLVEVSGGCAIVVRIPRSYRRPHMVVADGANELWIRRDRQKFRMSVEEVRNAVLSTEDLEMRAERFLETQRQRLGSTGDVVLMISVSPLTLQEGRVAIDDPRIKNLLQNTDTRAAGGLMLTGGRIGHPTVRGRRVDSDPSKSLEVFRSGHVEFVLRDLSSLTWIPNLATRHLRVERVLVLHSHTIAELVFRVVGFAKQLAEIVSITDPHLVSIALFQVHDYVMDSGTGQIGTQWTEGTELRLDPVLVGLDETAHQALPRILDPLWNAFGHEKCPLFNPDGTFIRPS